MMKEIPLTQGKVALVDDDLFDYLNKFNWYLNSEGYAMREEWLGGGKRKRIRMHREIMNTPEGMDTDHINGNRADNRRENLRVCTRSENLMNRKKGEGTSKYKGVYWFKPFGRWCAYIHVNGKRMNLKYHKVEEDAARAYNEAAKKYFGEFAKLNDV